MESLSLNVTLYGTFNVSKSIVIPYGIAISSVRAYRLPMEPELSSILCDTSTFVKAVAKIKSVITWQNYAQAYLQSFFTKGANSALELRGSTQHFNGAIVAGNERYVRCSSFSRILKLCSNIAYIILPTPVNHTSRMCYVLNSTLPKDGSITLGIISSTWSVFW